MERKMLNLRMRDKIRIKDLRKTSSTDIGYIAKKCKFKYGSHMMKAKDDGWG